MISFCLRLFLLLNFCHIYTSFNFFGNGGSWCPYQVDKYVSCQVRNGSETYYGSPICWKSMNGSFSCQKRVLYRPKFVKTYKKVKETKYKCCPAYYGNDCNQECFNCTTFQALENRVNRMESQLNNFVTSASEPRQGLNGRADLGNEIVDEGNNEDHEQLENAISGVIENVRNIDIRVRALEHKLSRMMDTIQQIVMANAELKSTINTLIAKNEESHHPQALPAAAENYYKIPHNEHNEEHSSHSRGKASEDHGQYPSFRILEQNLARGDIASTLNDDYGEENSSSTISPDEEYLDPFHVNDDDIDLDDMDLDPEDEDQNII